MSPELRWLLVAAPIAVTLAGATAFGIARHRHPPSPPSVPAAGPVFTLCRDHACALSRARDFEAVARKERSDRLDFALALTGAFERDDCDAATELGEAITRAHAATTDEVLALGYCNLQPRRVPSPPGAPPADAVARLERTGCEGECPEYTVTISADGTVDFDGRSWVDAKGARTWRIGNAATAELFAVFDRMAFWSIPPTYEAGVIDLPGATLTLTRGGVTQTVRDEAVCASTPSMRWGTCYLALRVDELARTATSVHGLLPK
ncbi:MAG TPA: DUF6438 domain-containing protein [Polyangiaceae bacterium]|jgi:hypothetical protein